MSSLGTVSALPAFLPLIQASCSYADEVLMKASVILLGLVLFFVGCASTQNPYENRYARMREIPARLPAGYEIQDYGTLRKELLYYRVCVVSLNQIKTDKHNLPMTCDGHQRLYYKGSADETDYGRLTLLLQDMVHTGFKVSCDSKWECLGIRENTRSLSGSWEHDEDFQAIRP